MKVKRVNTYVKGLDKVMQGGIPEGSVVLVAGKPGTMKSSFAFNILYHNANKNDCSGVYVTLEQSRDSLLANMDGLGMKLGGLEKEISVLDLGMIRKKLVQLTNQTWMEVFKMYLKNLKKNMDIDLVVIDSLPILEVMARFDSPREELFHFFEWLRDMDITAFLITEMVQGSEKFCNNSEDFLADGILHLDLRRDENDVKLWVSIVKMRQTHHSRSYLPLIFDKDGFEVVTD
ncbi:MAG: AAA family ATPase [Thermoplasmata archaeon]|nr:AAA family ATPase [Thermoplasmata archaeon]